MQATRIIAVRHGETAWNVDTRIQGHLDIALNDTGRWQARQVARALADEPLAAVYTSDLQRAHATAQAIERIAAAIRQPGGEQAVQLKVAEKAVEAYGKVASDATTTLIVPSNMTEVSALIGSAMKMVQTTQCAS